MYWQYFVNFERKNYDVPLSLVSISLVRARVLRQKNVIYKQLVYDRTSWSELLAV